MAMGRGFKVYHNLGPGGQLAQGPAGEEQSYSIVMEQRGKTDVLLMECIQENYVVVTLGKSISDTAGLELLFWGLTIQSS